MGTYDVIHVDGGHSEHCIVNDMMNTDRLIRLNGIVIIDDTDGPIINNVANEYIASGKYIEIDVLTTTGYPHRVLRKVSM